VAQLGARRCAAHLAYEPNRGLAEVKDDAYLRQFARDAAASGVPIFLRFASEMNGIYTPYHGNPRLYVEKWRLLTRVMREEAPNVAMVWCVFYYGHDAISPYYPGDAWVDWVGINIYNVYHHNNKLSHPAWHEDPCDGLQRVYRPYAARKPIMICEYGVTHREQLRPEVILEGFARGKLKRLYTALPAEFPRVKCVQYFSVDTLDERLAENNYSLTSNLNILAEYRDLIASPHYLTELTGAAWPAADPWDAARTPEVQALLTEGLSAKRAGRLTEAAERLEQGLLTAPEDPELHRVLGWTYLHLEALDRARLALEQVTRLDPDGWRGREAASALARLTADGEPPGPGQPGDEATAAAEVANEGEPGA
jgi:hypothetical protein